MEMLILIVVVAIIFWLADSQKPKPPDIRYTQRLSPQQAADLYGVTVAATEDHYHDCTYPFELLDKGTIGDVWKCDGCNAKFVLYKLGNERAIKKVFP